MKFPRVHLFVDAKCPALVSGKITGWAAPSKLVAILSPENTQHSPDGGSAAKALRQGRMQHKAATREVQIIIEGELMSGLLLGLGDHIWDVYYFADRGAMDKAETFERLSTLYRAFQQLVIQVESEFDTLHTELSEIVPEHERLDTFGAIEIVNELGLGDIPNTPELLIELADRYAAELAPAKSLELKAA